MRSFLFFASSVLAQSFLPAHSEPGSYSTNTCVKRSVLVYTSESSTYYVTDLGTSLPTAPTFCSNASISTSTVYGVNHTLTTSIPASTVTVFTQASATSIASGGDIIGFGTDTNVPFNTSASGPGVVAEVVNGTSGPLQPYTGDSYL